MGTYADERAAIENRFSVAWAATTLVKYENVEFQEPQNTSWVALTIINAGGVPLSLSVGETERHEGIIIVQIFTPKDKGTQTGRALADTVSAIFRMVKFSSGDSGTIICKVPSIATVGVREGWHQINMRIPFTRLKAYGP